MLKHILKENLIHVSMDKMDFSYRIPLQKIGNISNWKIGTKETQGIVLPHVSTWTLQLFAKKTMENQDKIIQQFKEIVDQHAPKNEIDWEETVLALNIQKEFNALTKKNETAPQKMSEEEIISALRKTYSLN